MACLCYFMIYSRTTDFSTNKILRKVLCKMMKRKSFKNILNQIFYQSADNRDTLMSHRRIGFTTRVSLLFKCIMPMQVGNYLSFLIHLSSQLFFGREYKMQFIPRKRGEKTLLSRIPCDIVFTCLRISKRNTFYYEKLYICMDSITQFFFSMSATINIIIMNAKRNHIAILFIKVLYVYVL